MTTVHHITINHVRADCGAGNMLAGDGITVSNDWGMVTCEKCLAHKPKEYAARNPNLALPCPWCNAQPNCALHAESMFSYLCENHRCSVQPQTKWFNNTYDALKAWNDAGREAAAERARIQQSIDGLTKDLSTANDKNLAKAREIATLEKGLEAIKAEAIAQADRIFRLAEENRQLKEKLKAPERLEPGEVITENRMRNEIRALIAEEFKKHETMTSPPTKPAQITIGLETWMLNKKQLTDLIELINASVKGT